MHTFRAIEGAFTRVQNVVEAGELRRFGEGGFRLVPDFVGTHALWTPAASALRLSNENKRVGRFASVAAFIKYKFINDLCLNKFAHFCFRCIRLVRYSGRVENFTTISSKPKGASASLFASVMTVCKQPVATLGSWIVVVDLTPLASAAAPRSCQNSEAQAFCRDARLARFSFTRAQKSATSHISPLGVPRTIVWVGLYCKATRAHLRHACAAHATKPRSASLVPKGSRFASSLSLTRNYTTTSLSFEKNISSPRIFLLKPINFWHHPTK